MSVAGNSVDASDLIAIFALIVSVLVYWQNRRMVAANTSMAESNRAMAETNKRMAQSVDISAQAAQKAVDLQIATVREERVANVVTKTSHAPGSAIPHAGLGEKGHLGLRIVNEGPANARDVVLHVTFADGTIRSSLPVTLLVPDKEISLKVPLYPTDFGDRDVHTFPYRVTYRDGNGPHELNFRIRLEGAWETPRNWQTFKEDIPPHN